MTEEVKPPEKVSAESIPDMLKKIEDRSRFQSKLVAIFGGIVVVLIAMVVVLTFAVGSMSSSLNRRSVVIDALNCYSTSFADFNSKVGVFLDAAANDDKVTLANQAKLLKKVDPEKCKVAAP